MYFTSTSFVKLLQNMLIYSTIPKTLHIPLKYYRLTTNYSYLLKRLRHLLYLINNYRRLIVLKEQHRVCFCQHPDHGIVNCYISAFLTCCQLSEHGSFPYLPGTSNQYCLEKVIHAQKFSFQTAFDLLHGNTSFFRIK